MFTIKIEFIHKMYYFEEIMQNRGALAGAAIRQRCVCISAWSSWFGKGKVEICAANTT